MQYTDVLSKCSICPDNLKIEILYNMYRIFFERCTMKFIDQSHRQFYKTYLSKCVVKDRDHKALIYLLGLLDETRAHITRLFNFSNDSINPEALFDDWTTSTAQSVIRLAFNLFTADAPTASMFYAPESSIREMWEYLPSQLFSTELCPYFIEAIELFNS